MKREAGAKRILILDDDPGVLHLLWSVLRHAGHRVSTAQDPAEAEERMRSERFEMLVTDHDMPRETGLSFVRRIRGSDGGALEPHRDIPVVMISGHCEPGHMDAVEAAGIDAFVQKPFRPADILSVMRQVGEGGGEFIQLLTCPGH